MRLGMLCDQPLLLLKIPTIAIQQTAGTPSFLPNPLVDPWGVLTNRWHRNQKGEAICWSRWSKWAKNKHLRLEVRQRNFIFCLTFWFTVKYPSVLCSCYYPKSLPIISRADDLLRTVTCYVLPTVRPNVGGILNRISRKQKMTELAGYSFPASLCHGIYSDLTF